MIRGLYTASAGMLANSARQEILTRNVENMNTPGYKGDAPIVRSFPSMVMSLLNSRQSSPSGNTLGALGTGVMMSAVDTSFEQGNLQPTDRPLDIAIQGPGFFVVQTPNGERVTRNGAFEVDGLGRLVTSDGDFIQGVNGQINLGTPGNITIDREGRVLADGQEVDRLLLVDFANRDQLARVSGSLFDPANATPTVIENPQVFSGYIEKANIDQVKLMSDMIAALRAYEASQKMVTYQNETLQRAVNDIGRII